MLHSMRTRVLLSVEPRERINAARSQLIDIVWQNQEAYLSAVWQNQEADQSEEYLTTK